MQSKITIRIILTILIVSVWASTAVAESAASSTKAKGATFSVPVPAGFSNSTDERIVRSLPGGVALVANKRAKPDMFLASIVVNKVASGADFDPSDPVFCKELADAMAGQVGLVLKANQIVMTTVGKMCQWTLADMKTPSLGAIVTLMYKTRDNAWVVTCNFDDSDLLAKAACTEVLKGWTFN